jgi:alginate O-acetyltransferase complex protein AlgI
MIFPSYIFILLFLPLVLLIWHLVKNLEIRLIFLNLASYIFYGWWDYRFTLLMLASTVLDYICGKRINDSNNSRQRKLWLLCSIAGNLGLLGFFKYYDFFVESAQSCLTSLNLPVSFQTLNIILPVGISFYTFQTMSYSIDIYKRKCIPADNFLLFSGYVSMFPQLVAGPIVRYSDIDKQLKELRFKKTTSLEISNGIWMFCLGLVKKILIADRLAPMADYIFNGSVEPQLFGSWLGVLCYTFQLYFDFSAYSDMAIGLGLMLGFNFPVNFNSPYKSKDISEFWNRWHITLSSWLRDYLYIPMGGSRVSTWKILRNLAITMFLGGLWHGAAWTFVIWGIMHGAYLIVNALWKKLSLFRLPGLAAVTITFVCVICGWVVFRAPTLERSSEIFAGMFGFNGIEGLVYTGWYGIPMPQFFEQIFYLKSPFVGFLRMAMLPLAMLIAFAAPNTNEIRKKMTPIYALILAALTLIVVFRLAHATPFLYFQF